MDPRHVNSHFSANELRACSNGSNPLLTLPSSAFRHWPTVSFHFVQQHLRCSLSGQQLQLPPPRFLLWGQHSHGHRPLYPLQPFSRPPTPPPSRPHCQKPPIVGRHLGSCHLHNGGHSNPITIQVPAQISVSLPPCLPQRKET